MTDEQIKAISTEVRDLVEQMIASGQSVEATWLVHAVVSTWEPPGGRDADKWTIAGYQAVRTIVRQVVQKWRPSNDETDPQVVLPGYEKLHSAYLIPRGGKQQVVRVDMLTVEEALSIVSELMRCKTGIDLHINELYRYIDEVLRPKEAQAS